MILKSTEICYNCADIQIFVVRININLGGSKWTLRLVTVKIFNVQT